MNDDDVRHMDDFSKSGISKCEGMLILRQTLYGRFFLEEG